MSAQYVILPQCDVNASAENIISNGYWVYDNGSRKRFFAMPEIGITFDNYINKHCFKTAYYAYSSLYFCVIGTLHDAEANPAVHASDDDTPSRTVQALNSYKYSTRNTRIDVYYFAFGQNYTLPDDSHVFSTEQALIDAFDDDNWEYVPPSTDPYAGGGYSGTGGGQGTGGQSGTGGNYDTSSDDMPIPNLPISIATGTGLFTAYNPSASQLANFADKLWNKDPTTFSDWWRYFFGGDAFSAIIGLSMIPVAPTTGSSKNIYLGNWDTGASAPPITNQYKAVDFGSVTLSEFWGNSIDYAPYTRVQLALPYIGIVDVDTDDVIGSVNTLSYHIDVLSGAFTAMLECVKGELDSVIYEWSGSCSAMLPISGASFNALGASILGMVGSAAAVGATALTGGSAAALAAGGLAMTGSAVSTFGSQKGKVQKSGSVSGNAGALGIQTPYFIISRPVQSVPSTQQITKGYPANISAHLGDLTGYTEVIEVHLHNIPGTNDEVLEIEELLKKGVIF